MWDDRFATQDYIFGTEPAEFLRKQVVHLPEMAKVLTVAEGEGRNATFLAQSGAKVTALEPSKHARAKARELARARGVDVTLIDADLRGWDWPEARFDVVLLCFAQFADVAFREDIFDGIGRALCPGGVALIHGFARRQLRYTSGGPKDVSQLYDLPLLRSAFPRWQVLHQADYDHDLSEGTGHCGTAALIDFVVRKPNR
ncbi:hypothetical protein BFP70_16680 [Thioclava sp. SK-1]|nr:hypothetical protein BFP70_16680 [Thioclava sp. SK-1]